MKARQSNHIKGVTYELVAAEYLERNGLQILETNYRISQGEIDLIVKDGEYLVFVEVKYRKSDAHGYPEEAVGIAKQRSICRVSDHYRMKHQIGEFEPMRYDVVSILKNEITWIKNAFPYRGY